MNKITQETARELLEESEKLLDRAIKERQYYSDMVKLCDVVEKAKKELNA